LDFLKNVIGLPGEEFRINLVDFVYPGRIYVKILVNNQVPPGL